MQEEDQDTMYTTFSQKRFHLQEEDRDTMYACLRTIFERAPEFGGGLFALAASVMADLTHHDPLCFPGLDAAGLPKAFIKAIKVRLSLIVLGLSVLIRVGRSSLQRL